VGENTREKSANELETSKESWMNDEEEMEEYSKLDESNFDENDDEILKQHNDPFFWGRRRRRGRRWWSSVWNKIRAFFSRHGPTIKIGIRALKKVAYRCCNVTRECNGKRWCKLSRNS